jgi:hypothetical protein
MDPINPDGKAQSDVSELLVNLNFVPQWARQSPQANPYARHEGRERRDERPERPSRDRREAPRGPRPANRGERRGPMQGERGAPPRFPQREEQADRRFAPPPPAPVYIAFIPERERLARLVHDMHAARRAWPMAEIAQRFLANLDACLVKIEAQSAPRQEPNGKGGPSLYQCAECQAVFLDAGAAEGHALAKHLDKIYQVEAITGEPPAGNFTCVARCRMSGELLGPPNHHGYQEKMLALYRERYAHMSLDEYRNTIETSREPAMIEKWKEESCKQTVYKAKGVENAPALKRAEAEAEFRAKALPGMIHRGHRFITPARGTRDWDDDGLRRAIQDTWQRESRFPASLMFALRPAFKHMHLHLFKAGGGITFVTPIHPHALAPEHAVAQIREVLEFLHAHPGCTRQQLIDGLRPGAAAESPEVIAVLSPLRWLIDRGHVIEFYDGTLAVPMSGPRQERPPPPPQPPQHQR